MIYPYKPQLPTWFALGSHILGETPKENYFSSLTLARELLKFVLPFYISGAKKWGSGEHRPSQPPRPKTIFATVEIRSNISKYWSKLCKNQVTVLIAKCFKKTFFLLLLNKKSYEPWGESWWRNVPPKLCLLGKSYFEFIILKNSEKLQEQRSYPFVWEIYLGKGASPRKRGQRSFFHLRDLTMSGQTLFPILTFQPTASYPFPPG